VRLEGNLKICIKNIWAILFIFMVEGLVLCKYLFFLLKFNKKKFKVI
jgi:hypothetical protein